MDDRAGKLEDTVHHLASALEHVKRFSSIPGKWPAQDREFNKLIRDARGLAGPMSDRVRLGGLDKEIVMTQPLNEERPNG